jgi:hypothetical protein
MGEYTAGSAADAVTDACGLTPDAYF